MIRVDWHKLEDDIEMDLSSTTKIIRQFPLV